MLSILDIFLPHELNDAHEPRPRPFSRTVGPVNSGAVVSHVGYSSVDQRRLQQVVGGLEGHMASRFDTPVPVIFGRLRELERRH